MWDGQAIANLEHGQAGWWGAQGGAANNNRMMMIGWVRDFHGDAGPGIQFLTRLTLLREVNWDVKTNNLVSNPVPELLGLRSGAPIASEQISLPAGTPHVVANTSDGAAASADITIKFSSTDGNWGSGDVSFGACVLGNGTVDSGIGISISLTSGQSASQARINSGSCQLLAPDTLGGIGSAKVVGTAMQLFEGESEITVRVLPDRSVAGTSPTAGRQQWCMARGLPPILAMRFANLNAVALS